MLNSVWSYILEDNANIHQQCAIIYTEIVWYLKMKKWGGEKCKIGKPIGYEHNLGLGR